MIASASTFRVGQGLIRRGANIDFHSRFHLSVPLRHPGAVPHLFSISFVSIPTSRRPRRTLHLQTSDGGVRGGAETFFFFVSISFSRRRTEETGAGRSGAGGRRVGRGEEEVKERQAGEAGGSRGETEQEAEGGREG